MPGDHIPLCFDLELAACVLLTSLSRGLRRVGVKNCGALEHRCERTTRAGSADTMATMLDNFWTHTHTYNAVILSAAVHASRCKLCCLRYERTPPDGSPRANFDKGKKTEPTRPNQP